MTLGIDIGNVIIEHRYINKDDATLLEERYSTIPATDGVFEYIRKLNDTKFHGNILLVSKCTPWAEKKILAWLDDNDFYGKTGVDRTKVFFCRERHEKDMICKDNKVTHFIDDRLEVLGHMIKTVPNLYLYRPSQSEVDEYQKSLPNVTRVESWQEIVDKI